MGDNYDIDTDVLITLVQRRPLLWDKTHEKYKHKCKTQEAWREIFSELNKNFAELDDSKHNEFGKQVVKKWTQVRDSYRKSLIRTQSSAKSGSGGSKMKSYIYASQLRFLDKIFQENTENTLSEENIDDVVVPKIEELSTSNNYEVAAEVAAEASNTGSPLQEFTKSRPRKRKAFEMEFTSVLKEAPNRHLSFFKGLLPSIQEFDETDTLDFQMKVLKIIKHIRQRKHPRVHRQQQFAQTSYSTSTSSSPVSDEPFA